MKRPLRFRQDDQDKQQLKAEAGETLIEVLISSALMALVVVAIIGGVATVVLGAHVHRKQADGNTVLVAAMEQVRSPDTARVCPPASYSVPPGVSVTKIEYQTITADSVTGNPVVTWSQDEDDCSLSSPLTLQRIALQFATTDSTVSSTLSFVKGKY